MMVVVKILMIVMLMLMRRGRSTWQVSSSMFSRTSFISRVPSLRT